MSEQKFKVGDIVKGLGFERGVVVDNNIHVIPNDGNQHQESETCWCNPYWDEQNKLEYKSGLANKKLYIHKDFKEIIN